MHSFLRPSNPEFAHSIPRRPNKISGEFWASFSGVPAGANPLAMPRHFRVTKEDFKMRSTEPKTLAEHGKRFLRRTEAATYVTDRYGFPCSRQWLAKLAVVGGGPVFRK